MTSESVELAIQYIQQYNNIIIEFLPNPSIPKYSNHY